MSGDALAREIDAYYLALGRFIDRFSRLELALQYALWDKSGVDEPTAQALFSGVRAREALNQLKRLFIVEENKLPPLLARVSQRFDILMDARNLIVHHGAEWTVDGMIVSSVERNIPTKGRTFPISAEILAQLTTDVSTLQACVLLWRAQQYGILPMDEAKLLWEEHSQRAWQYIPPAPADH